MKLPDFKDGNELDNWFNQVLMAIEPGYRGDSPYSMKTTFGVDFKLIQEYHGGYRSRFRDPKPDKVLGVQLSVRDNRYRSKIKKVMVKESEIDLEELRKKYSEIREFKEKENQAYSVAVIAQGLNNKKVDSLRRHADAEGVNLQIYAEYPQSMETSFSVKVDGLSEVQVKALVTLLPRKA